MENGVFTNAQQCGKISPANKEGQGIFRAESGKFETGMEAAAEAVGKQQYSAAYYDAARYHLVFVFLLHSDDGRCNGV